MLVAAVAKFRSVAPYLIMALVVPGGLLMAPLLWLYRRQKQAKIFRTHVLSVVRFAPVGGTTIQVTRTSAANAT
jgi:hypothetical protein